VTPLVVAYLLVAIAGVMIMCVFMAWAVVEGVSMFTSVIVSANVAMFVFQWHDGVVDAVNVSNHGDIMVNGVERTEQDGRGRQERQWGRQVARVDWRGYRVEEWVLRGCAKYPLVEK
jgi:hypothetical protein